MDCLKKVFEWKYAFRCMIHVCMCVWVTYCVCAHVPVSADTSHQHHCHSQFHKPFYSMKLRWRDDRVVCHVSSLPSSGVKVGQEVRGFKPCASRCCMTQLSFKHSCFCWEELSYPMLPGSFWFRHLSQMLLHFGKWGQQSSQGAVGEAKPHNTLQYKLWHTAYLWKDKKSVYI